MNKQNKRGKDSKQSHTTKEHEQFVYEMENPIRNSFDTEKAIPTPRHLINPLENRH